MAFASYEIGHGDWVTIHDNLPEDLSDREVICEVIAVIDSWIQCRTPQGELKTTNVRRCGWIPRPEQIAKSCEDLQETWTDWHRSFKEVSPNPPAVFQEYITSHTPRRILRDN